MTSLYIAAATRSLYPRSATNAQRPSTTTTLSNIKSIHVRASKKPRFGHRNSGIHFF